MTIPTARQTLVALLLGAATSAGLGAPPAATTPDTAAAWHARRPPSIEETARRVALTLRTGRSGQAGMELAAESTPSARAPMAWDDLAGVLSAMDRWLDAYDASAPRERAFAGLARQSQRAATAAHTDMVQVKTDFAGALRHLGMAVRRLTNARDLVRRDRAATAWANQVLNELTAVAARLAEDGLQRARNGGVDTLRVTAANHALQQGRALLLRGQHLQAIAAFGLGITVGDVPVFDMDRFEANLRAVFNPQTVGLQYAIAREGALARLSETGNGLARTNADPPNTAQVGDKEMNIASVSKPITAIALLRLLDQRNLSVDSPIAPWLPATWVLGAGIQLPNAPTSNPPLSFRDLLTHRSGLNANLNTDYRYVDLQNYVAAGIVASDKLTYVYQNANYAMFRVAIPYLYWGANGVNQIAALVPFAPIDEVIAGLYIEAVRDLVFAPTGFVQGGCVASDPVPTLSYPFPSNGVAGNPAGDWINRCGSGGWYLSSLEVLGVMAYRRYTNLILSPATRQLMDFGFLGWQDPADNYARSSGLYGVYRTHGGTLNASGPLGTCYMEFFNGVQVAMGANSGGGNYLGNNSHQCDAVKWAFENAFVAP